MTLSFAIWTPIVFGLLILVYGSDHSRIFVRWTALVGAVLGLAITLAVVYGFDPQLSSMQFSEQFFWLPIFGAYYALGVDGISLWLLPLTALVTCIVVVAAWEVVTERVAQYMAAFLILSGLLLGAFSARDGLLFYVFFEATLIPMYLIIGAWGGPRRVYAALKFFLYTLLGSLLALLAMLYLRLSVGSFDIQLWHQAYLSLPEQIWLFAAFFLAFAVKVPMWPVHTWLPDAHVEAPTGGSVVLAAIMLKLGAYGFLRFCLPITPDASHYFAPAVITLSLVAVIYIGLVALVQTDMKKLVAYASIAHMGFVTLGCFVFQPLALAGALVQMISHGIISAGMFLCIGALYDRAHSREILDYGGVASNMPKFAALMLFFSLANCGLPGTSGFVGEWMVILGTVQVNFWLGLCAAIALVLGAAYSLWMVKRVIFGSARQESAAQLVDLSRREFSMLLLLAVLVVAVGIYPRLLTDAMQSSVHALLHHAATSKLSP